MGTGEGWIAMAENRFWGILPGLWLAAVAVGAWGQVGQDLPPSPDYRGEIRRGADGRLMVVPAQVQGAAASAGEVRARATMVVGPGERIATITEAARLARDGEVIEIRPGDYRRQPAVWTQDNLVIRGGGQRPVMIGDGAGAGAEGKGIWVVRGGKVRIENIEFRGARAPAGGGAGIRLEKGQLTVRRCAFFDDETGLVAGDSPETALEVADSEFGSAPAHPGPARHLLLVGEIGSFSLTGSRLYGGNRGALVRTGARVSRIYHNMLLDGPEGRAAYELEFPRGGLAFVVGNTIGQSAATGDPVLVAYGTEGVRWPENGLYLVHNTLTNDGHHGDFLKVWQDKVPADAEIWVLNNLTVGQGNLFPPARGRFEGNQSLASRAELAAVGGIPLRLTNLHPLRGTIRPPGSARGEDLSPRAEFVFPVGTRPVTLSSSPAPGAFQ